jgi:hypothetical protein
VDEISEESLVSPLDVIEERPFPVVESISLRAVPRRRFRRASRSAEDIPRQRPGTVLVAQLNDTYQLVPSGAQPHDPVLVKATSLLLVSIRRQLVESAVLLPSADPRNGVQVRARFQCRVTDPVLVLQAGGWDIQPFLIDHLLGYPRLRMAALAQVKQNNWFEFQQRLLALLIAHSEVSAVQVPGLTATLADAAVTLRPLLHPTARLDDSGASHSWGDASGDSRDGDPTFTPANYRWDAAE